jgi:hypothetical protein
MDERQQNESLSQKNYTSGTKSPKQARTKILGVLLAIIVISSAYVLYISNTREYQNVKPLSDIVNATVPNALPLNVSQKFASAAGLSNSTYEVFATPGITLQYIFGRPMVLGDGIVLIFKLENYSGTLSTLRSIYIYDYGAKNVSNITISNNPGIKVIAENNITYPMTEVFLITVNGGMKYSIIAIMQGENYSNEFNLTLTYLTKNIQLSEFKQLTPNHK